MSNTYDSLIPKMPGGKDRPVLKNFTRDDCMKGAQQRYTFEKMGCGTDPDPANSQCIRKAMNNLGKNQKNCPQ
jgi:hypothetical protein